VFDPRLIGRYSSFKLHRNDFVEHLDLSDDEGINAVMFSQFVNADLMSHGENEVVDQGIDLILGELTWLRLGLFAGRGGLQKQLLFLSLPLR
jgi:hypothetical protein